jgi:predicted transcriptional regulator of viral defense system
MKVNKFFEAHPVFRYEEFANFMLTHGTKRPESWRQQLNYHQKVGHLIHIRKSLYAVNPKFNHLKLIDPYVIASKAVASAVIAYHTALELYGIAYTTFNEFTFITCQLTKPFSYEGNKFRPVFQIKEISIQHEVNTIKRDGMAVSITSLERTIVDVLDRPDLSGGWEEIWRSLDNIIKFDVNKLIKYAISLKNATTVAKVGFFLEHCMQHFTVDKKCIKKLLPYIPKSPHYITRDKRYDAKYISEWQLMVPLSIINRTWEESDVDNI